MAKYHDAVRGMGTRICAALGINPNEVASLDLHLEAGQPPIITARIYVQDEQAEQIAVIITERTWQVVEPEEATE